MSGSRIYARSVRRTSAQSDKGKAKAYQVRQVLLALDKLEHMRDEH